MTSEQDTVREEVTVVIPIYRLQINELERRSLECAINVFAKRRIVVIHPKSLDMSSFAEQYPTLSFKTFDDNYFAGIAGYNRLMLSETFYTAFSSSRYILIYQLDAWAFRDDLSRWCHLGYDYVGAPWLRKPFNRLPIVKQWLDFKGWAKHQLGKPSKQALYDKVGNGGLSLRCVESHINVLRNQSDRVEHYLSQKRHHLYNEDVFWALEPEGFKYPSPCQALRFAFDKYPSYSFKITRGQLPMGCHGWYKRKMKSFWRDIIEF